MERKTRYRQRLKLQAALTHVMETLADNTAKGIPPDRTTALMAGQVISKLLAFAREAGLSPAETLADKADLSRIVYLKKARQKETAARYRRRSRGAHEPPAKPEGSLPKSARQVLTVLAGLRAGSMSRKVIAEQVYAGEGSKPKNGRVVNDTDTYRRLLADGLVTKVKLDIDGWSEVGYRITPNGRAALAAALKAEKSAAAYPI